MARELRVGDRVRTPHGDGIVTGTEAGALGDGVIVLITGIPGIGATYRGHAEPLPADIPRECVEALHAAVTKRVEQLASEEALDDDCAAVAHLELSEVAEALRLLLEVADRLDAILRGGES